MDGGGVLPRSTQSTIAELSNSRYRRYYKDYTRRIRIYEELWNTLDNESRANHDYSLFDTNNPEKYPLRHEYESSRRALTVLRESQDLFFIAELVALGCTSSEVISFLPM